MPQSYPHFTFSSSAPMRRLTQEELRQWQAVFQGLMHGVPEDRIALLKERLLLIMRQWQRFGAAWRRYVEGLVPPGTDLAKVRFGLIIPPAAEAAIDATSSGEASAALPFKIEDLQAHYDARVTPEYAPTYPDDFIWAKAHGLTQAVVAVLRKNNPDKRLHGRHRRRK